MVTMTSLLPYQTTHSLSELCETHFEKSGWTGDFTTDIEGLRSALEDVYTLGFEDLSWEELEKVCSDSNADAATPSPLTALYPDAVVPRIRIPNDPCPIVKRAQAIGRLAAQDMERSLVPRTRSEDRVFEEATNAQLRASLRLCGQFPPYEYYSKRDVLIAAYVKAPMVLSNLAQCEHLAGKVNWVDAEVGKSTILSDGGPYEFYPDCLRYGDDMAATPVPETAEQRVAKLEQQLKASQAELLAAKVGGAGGAPMASAGAGPSAGISLRPPTPLTGISLRAIPPPPAYAPSAGPAPIPVPVPKPTPVPVVGSAPAPAPLVAGPSAGVMPFGGLSVAQLEQQARQQQAQAHVQQLSSRISVFPGATCTSLLASLANAERGFVDGSWTPTQFWDWIAQGNAGMAQKEQASFQAQLAQMQAQAMTSPVPTPLPTPVVPPRTAPKRKVVDSDDEADEADLSAWQTAAFQPVDGCLSGKATTLQEAVQEMVVATSGLPAQRKAYLASDRAEQDAQFVARKEARQLQILHQCVTRQEWQDKLMDLRVLWEAAKSSQLMMQKLLRQLPSDGSQDSAVARASMEVLVLQKTTELSGLDSRMMVYLEAHEMAHTSNDSVATIDKWVADRVEELTPKSVAVVKREGQMAKIRKTSTLQMQNEIISIQLAQTKAGYGGAPPMMPMQMPGMGMLSPPVPPQAWPGVGAPPQLATNAVQPSLAPRGARLVPLSKYVDASRLQAFDQNVLLIAQEEFPAATNMDTHLSPVVNQAHRCTCCGLQGHKIDLCGFSGLPHELCLPSIIDLQGQWKLLTPRQARRNRVVSKAHSKLPDKQVGVS